MEAKIRTARAILDKAEESFGPETRAQLDTLRTKTEDTNRIENEELREVLPTDAWCFLALRQLTEVVGEMASELAALKVPEPAPEAARAEV